jgi:DNA-binding transcriptional MerR regulator
MTEDDLRYSIGDLARRTGLPVKTIRFYADEGVVPETGRTPAGYRVYDVGAVARLDLVRTLRELGVDLPTIRRVLAREATLTEVAAAHAQALDVQIRTLRRAVLGAVAARGATHQEMDLMRPPPPAALCGLHHELTVLVRERIGRAVADGIEPESHAADPVIAELGAQGPVFDWFLRALRARIDR